MKRGIQARVLALEAVRPSEPVRVVITRRIVGGGAREEGEALRVVRTERREFVLYAVRT